MTMTRHIVLACITFFLEKINSTFPFPPSHSEFECHTFSVFEILLKFTKNFYCFGDKNANICYGDSGSALVCKRSNGQFETVGVAVMMDYPPCGEPYPGQKASNTIKSNQKNICDTKKTILVDDNM